MTKFRIGDVVVREGAETRVADVIEMAAGSWDLILLDTPCMSVSSDQLTLLRRPLQPGDILRHRDAYDYRMRVMSVTDAGVHAADLENDAYSVDLIPSAWLHEDGTPIEHPELHRPDDGWRPGDESFNCRCVFKPLSDAVTPLKQPQPIVPDDEPSVTVNVGLGAPTVEDLAKAFFRTDPEVLSVVRRAADAVRVSSRETETRLMYEGENVTVTCTVEEEDESRIDRALDVAWRIDESGRRTFWLERAKAAHALLVGGSK
jgi:hypothetical protein